MTRPDQGPAAGASVTAAQPISAVGSSEDEKKTTIERQWNSRSDDMETIFSTIRVAGFARIQAVILSPRTSLSFAFVAEKTFTPS